MKQRFAIWHRLRRAGSAAQRGIQVFCRAMGILASITIVMMMITTVTDVTVRYLRGKPLPGIIEGNELLMVAIVFLGLAYTQLAKGHIRVDMFIGRLSPRRRALLNTLGWLVALIVFALILIEGWEVAYQAYVTQDYRFGLIKFPYWPSKMMVPFGALLICLQLTIDIVQNIQEVIRPSLRPVGATTGQTS